MPSIETSEKPLSNPTAALLDLSLLHQGPRFENTLRLRRQITPKQTRLPTPFPQLPTTYNDYFLIQRKFWSHTTLLTSRGLYPYHKDSRAAAPRDGQTPMSSRLDCPICLPVQPKLWAPKNIISEGRFPSHPAAVLLPPDIGP